MKYLSITLLVVALGLAGYSFYQKSKVDELTLEIEDKMQEVSDMSGRVASYQAQLDTMKMKNEELKQTILKLANDLSRETPEK
jgi:cell division protein FtsL